MRTEQNILEKVTRLVPQTELAMRGSGGFLGTGGWETALPGPAVTKKMAVVRVWRTLDLKR